MALKVPTHAEPYGTSLGTSVRPIAVGALQTTVLAPAEGHARVFARHRAVECADLLDADFLDSLLDRCRRGTFLAEYVDRIGSRAVEAPQRVGPALNIALSRSPLLRWVEAATGREGLGCVEGRVVQTSANGVDGLDWHRDTHADGELGARRLGITINLSDTAFQGGAFELRRVATDEPLAIYRHDRPGTALIFDITHDIEHRVLPLLGGGPRRVFTGWFMSGARLARGKAPPPDLVAPSAQ